MNPFKIVGRMDIFVRSLIRSARSSIRIKRTLNDYRQGIYAINKTVFFKHWWKPIFILPIVGLSFCTFIAIRPKRTFSLIGHVHGTTFPNSFSNSFKHSAIELGEWCSWSWFPSLVGCNRNEAFEMGFDVESIQMVNFNTLIPDLASDGHQFIFI